MAFFVIAQKDVQNLYQSWAIYQSHIDTGGVTCGHTAAK